MTGRKIGMFIFCWWSWKTNIYKNFEWNIRTIWPGWWCSRNHVWKKCENSVIKILSRAEIKQFGWETTIGQSASVDENQFVIWTYSAALSPAPSKEIQHTWLWNILPAPILEQRNFALAVPFFRIFTTILWPFLFANLPWAHCLFPDNVLFSSHLYLYIFLTGPFVQSFI